MTWNYNGKEFTANDIGNHVGFVYCITNITTGRRYLGKKLFSKAKTTQVKGKKKKSRVSSDWLEYYGSNKILQEEVKQLGPDNYKREILHLCKSLSECSYWETYEIFVQGALIGDNFYNEWVSARIVKKNLKNIFKQGIIYAAPAHKYM